jgi:hypothetical protein
VWSKHKLDNVLRDIYVQNIKFIKQEGIKRLFASNIKKQNKKVQGSTAKHIGGLIPYAHHV